MAKFTKFSGRVYKKVHGESSSVIKRQQGQDTFLLYLMSECAVKDILNATECALFFNILPGKIYTLREESCKGSKENKERLTIQVYADVFVSEKFSLLTVGKSE